MRRESVSYFVSISKAFCYDVYMGSITEINTIVKLTNEVDASNLLAGQDIEFTKQGNRILPIGIALLLADSEWNFVGYCLITSIKAEKNRSVLDVKVLSRFNEAEALVFKSKFMEATAQTGEFNQ